MARLNEPSRDLPNGIFDAPPPFGKKVLLLTIEIDEHAPDSTLSFIFTGSTYAYKDRLSEAGVGGGRMEQEDGQQGAYYRVVKDIDVSEEANQQKLIAVLDVFDGLATLVKISGAEIPKDSDTESFIDRLKEVENLFFFKPSEPSEPAPAAGGGA